MATRFMNESDDNRVRYIFAVCYPERPPHPPTWFQVHPTIVATEDVRDTVVGYTSLIIDPSEKLVHYRDIAVMPEYRGQNFGMHLFQRRQLAGMDLGITSHVGATWAENKRMIRLFENNGFHLCQRVPGYYPDGKEGLIFVNHGGGLIHA
jgi:ribosomal protein S18 acetylase RimI-like enzyme